MLRFQQLIQLALLTVGLIICGPAAAQQNPTLADVLKREAIPYPRTTVLHLNSRITSYATLNDAQEFLIAYYLDNPQNELRFPLFLTRFDKRTGKWRHVELAGVKVKIFEGTDHEMPDDCLGSALSIERNGKWYYLNLHLTPSAGCLVILKHD